MKKINLLKRAVLLCLCISLSVSAFAVKPYIFAADSADLTELTDPAELTELTYSTNSTVLYSDTMDDAGWDWKLTDDGVLTITINQDGSTSWTDTPAAQLPWYVYRNDIIEVELPHGLTNIGSNAFAGYENLATINFPNTLEEIGWDAFSRCSSLGEIDLSSTSLTTIGISAFYDSSITSITFPSTLEEIKDSAFSSCEQLKTVNLSGTNLKAIGRYAFSFPSPPVPPPALTSITFPDSLEKIGDNAFAFSTNLKTVDLSNTQLKVIDARVFSYNSTLASIILPNTLEEIGDNAFIGCWELETINLSNTKLKSIGNHAFNTSGLTSITLPNTLEEIKSSAFLGCADLEAIDLSNTNLKTIGEVAFADCTKMTDIFIPGSVISIANDRIDLNTIITDTNSDLIIFGIYDSYAIEWAHESGYRWFYQAHEETMNDKHPPEIHQNVPVEFTFNTAIPHNDGMAFSITPQLPAGLTLQTNGTGEYAPGTIYGVVTDPAVIEQYKNGRTFTVTARPEGYPSGRYDVTVEFTLTLVPKSGDATADGDVTDMFGFEQGGRLGGDTGLIEFDENGNPNPPPVMRLNAPFGKNSEGYGFHEFYINGMLRTRGTVKDDPNDGDYYAEEGSTIITIRDQTFAELGDGTHTATATFRRVDDSSDIELDAWKAEAGDWDIRVQSVSQNFIINHPSPEPGPGPNPEPGPKPDPQPQPNPQPNSQSDSQTRSSTRSQPQPQPTTNTENETSDNTHTAQNTDSTPNSDSEQNPTAPNTPETSPSNTESNNNTENTSGNTTDNSETQNPPVENNNFSTEGNTVNPTGGAAVNPTGVTITDDEYLQTIISGLGIDENGNYYFILDDSGEPFKVRIDIPLDEFIQLYIDGLLLTLNLDYTVTEGSTIIEISAERLAEFGSGLRTMSAVFLNETVNITFDIILPAPQVQVLEVTPSVPAVAVNEVQGVEAVSEYSDVAESGNSVVIVFCALIVLAGGVAGFVIIKRRRSFR
ncbi:MAG: phage tail tube protein [Oscillospiraceae bacterium]|nr:phage tail tube protein [Oscillospiraceae bacterium]